MANLKTKKHLKHISKKRLKKNQAGSGIKSKLIIFKNQIKGLLKKKNTQLNKQIQHKTAEEILSSQQSIIAKSKIILEILAAIKTFEFYRTVVMGRNIIQENEYQTQIEQLKQKKLEYYDKLDFDSSQIGDLPSELYNNPEIRDLNVQIQEISERIRLMEDAKYKPFNNNNVQTREINEKFEQYKNSITNETIQEIKKINSDAEFKSKYDKLVDLVKTINNIPKIANNLKEKYGQFGNFSLKPYREKNNRKRNTARGPYHHQNKLQIRKEYVIDEIKKLKLEYFSKYIDMLFNLKMIIIYMNMNNYAFEDKKFINDFITKIERIKNINPT